MRSLLFVCVLLFAAHAAAQGTLLAVYNNFSRIDEVNPVNGASISQTALTSSVTIFGFTGLAQDPTTGTLYAAVRTSSTSLDIFLGTIDRGAGSVTLLGEFNIGGTGESVSALQFDDAGTLWAMTGVALSGTPTPETMFTVDKSNGNLTVFQDLTDNQASEALGFFPTNNTVMYHFSGDATHVFQTVNLTSGATSNITISNPPTGAQRILCMAYDSNSAWFWTCTNSNEYGYIRPNGQYVVFGTMAGQAKGMVVLPTMDTSANTLALGTVTQGTAGTPQSFNLTGFNLFGDVTIDAPTGVEISLSAASGYAASLNVPRSGAGGQLASTQVFARIAAGAPQGAINANLDLTALGAELVQVAVTGQVNPPPTPEMDVTRGGTITDGNTDAAGNVPVSVPTALNYTITNSGGVTLNMANAVLGSFNNCAPSTTTQPPATLAPAANAPFNVSVTVSGAAAFSFTISIDNDDPNEDPYNWTVSGTGVPNVPEMDVLRGATPIADGATDAVGSHTTGQAFTLTYAINNTGVAALTLTVPVVPAGALNCTVGVTADPSASVAAAGTTQLVLSVTPLADGAFSFSISIANNDPNEDPYDFVVSGTAAAGGGGGGGDGGGDDGGGCSTADGGARWWLSWLGVLGLAALSLRLRRAGGDARR